MKNSAFEGTTKEKTRVAGSLSRGTTRVKPDHKAPPRAPRWVKILAIVAIVLFLLFALLRFTVIPYLHSLSGHAGFNIQAPSVAIRIHGGLFI